MSERPIQPKVSRRVRVPRSTKNLLLKAAKTKAVDQLHQPKYRTYYNKQGSGYKVKNCLFSIQPDVMEHLNHVRFKSRMVNDAVRTMMWFKKYRSLPYDLCHVCGCDMTAALDPKDSSNTIINEWGEIIEVFIQCEGCGGRMGHRQYIPSMHVLDTRYFS